MGPENAENIESSYHDNDGGPEASASSSPRIHIRSNSADIEHGQNSLPVWRLESSKSFRWRWVPYRARQLARSVVLWSKGPEPPQIQKITPFFPHIQEFLVKLIQKHLPKRTYKAALLATFYLCWILSFSLVLNYSASAGDIKGYGQPEPVWCGASFWFVISGLLLSSIC